MRICGNCGGGFIGDDCEACTQTVLSCEPVASVAETAILKTTMSNGVFVPNADIVDAHNIISN